MYLWNIHRLKQELSEGELSESEKFKYLFAYIISSSLSSLPTSKPTEPLVVILSILGPMVVAGGLYYCYQKNGGRNGKSFVQRFLALSWVASCRWGTMVLVPYLTIFVILVTIKVIAMNPIVLMLGIFVITVFLYWRIGHHINDVSIKYEQNNKPTTSIEFPPQEAFSDRTT